MKPMHSWSRGQAELLLSVLIATSLALVLPGPHGRVMAATDSLELVPAADGWVNRGSITANYGSATVLRARMGKAESYLRFDLAAWRGLRISALSFTLAA